MKKSEFYTLKGYKIRQKYPITESMEDYLEMIYRYTRHSNSITIKELSSKLNVRPSSASKMIGRLKEYDLVIFEKYGDIFLSHNGKMLGKYLLWRHNILEKFFKHLNKEKYRLEQVEKIEHFIDHDTIINMQKFINNKKNI